MSEVRHVLDDFISQKTLRKARENDSFEAIRQKGRRDEKNHETNGVA